MSNNEPARTAARPTRSTPLAALVVVGTALIGICHYQSLAALSWSVTSPIAAPPLTPRPGTPGKADGVVPDGVTVFDDRYPAVAKLEPNLLRALRHAATDAADDGITFFVNSGWRSRAYQNQLFCEAVSKYGSEAEAARWVATVDTSPHVSGDAVDIGPAHAAAWLSKHGTQYGLCQIYRNEPWHFELRPNASVNGCPPKYADPTHDPRMK